MTAVLGVHCGHEASVAVVVDGVVAAAIQQERVTRRKYDGQECLSDRLPIPEVLAAAGIGLDDVDLIVSSFQAAGPNAVGLQRPLFTADFSHFDPFDARHLVVSHHLAHAACTAGLSGFPSATVLVSDSAGSTTRDGHDYFEPFADFHPRYTADSQVTGVFTEMRSIYRYDRGGLELKARDFSESHNQPDVYMQGEASLYDNLARFVFRKEHSHGQLMALGGLPFDREPRLSADDILDGERVRNGWQQLPSHADPTEYADIAAAVQDAFTTLVVHQAERAIGLTGERRLACAGGVFLNLTGNTAIAELDGVQDVYVPSCPHDAGISIGAAFHGYHHVARTYAAPARTRADFFGRTAQVVQPEAAAKLGFTTVEDSADKLLLRAAELLVDGAVLARYAGRAEFGPRALGNRSILSHVGCPEARAKLNKIKGRQWWRPVAPVVRAEDVHRFFTGPAESPFMNFNFAVRPEYREQLREGLHLDDTARVQTVSAGNPLYGLLCEIDALGAIPVLINTSLNGPGEPILETAEEVLDFARRTDVDHVLSETHLFQSGEPELVVVQRKPGAVLATFGDGDDAKYLLSDTDGAVEIDRALFLTLCGAGPAEVDRHRPAVAKAMEAGLVSER